MKTSLFVFCAALLATAFANAADKERISLDTEAGLNYLIGGVDGSISFKENLVLEKMEVPVDYLAKDNWGSARGVAQKKQEIPALKMELPAAKNANVPTNCYLSMDSESDKINLTTNGAKARLVAETGDAPGAEAGYFRFRFLRVNMHFADRDRQALITCDGRLSLRALQKALADKGMQVTWAKLPAVEEKYVERIEVQDLSEVEAK